MTTRALVITKIRDALRLRSGKPWSVSGGRGTAYGWIHVTSPKNRRLVANNDGTTGFTSIMSDEDQAKLAELLGLGSVPHQGVGIPSGSDFYQEYIDRAEGREPSVRGERNWD